MQLPALKSNSSKVFAVMLALTASMGTMQATLLSTTSTVALTCNTSTGLGAAGTVVVKPTPALTGGATMVVTFASATQGLVITAPGVTTLTASTSAAGLTYTVNLSPGCAGATAGSITPHFQFSAGGTADLVVNTTATVTAAASALSPAPASVSINCVKVSSTYTPGSAQTVSVTSAATGGSAFTVDNSVTPYATWLTVAPLTGGTATSSPVAFTMVATAGCGGLAAGSINTTTVHLLNAPAPDKTISVTLQIVGPSPLTVTPASGAISYTKLSGVPGYVDIAVTASATPFFSVDATTLPSWLTASLANGGSAPKSVRFSSTSIADTLSPGSYSATVHLKVSGSGDQVIPISLAISNPAAKLSVGEGVTRNLSWTVGTPIPTPFVTLISSDSPIPYTLVTAGPLAPIISSTSGLAYSFGTPIPVTFNPLIFAAATPGSSLAGSVTITSGSPATSIVVLFSISILSPGASVSSLAPASLPTAAAGQIFTVSMVGTGFVPSTDPSQKTKVGVVVSGIIIADTNIAATVVDSSHIILTVTVPASADAYLPFSPTGAGGSVILGICNPAGGTCSTATGTATLSIGSNPIIQSVTSASAYLQVTAPTLPNVAPYDLVSIFGTNFCSSGGTGCSSTQLLYSTPDTATLRYPTFVSPDGAGATQRQLSVTFQTHATPPVVIGSSPILFASNGQINVVAPGALLNTYVGQTVDVVVNFGYATGTTMKSSSPFSVNIIATNPGIFTVGSDGQGAGAILAANYSVISSSNNAGMRSVATDSDTVQVYMTGLGLPTSTASNASAGTAGGAVYPTDCVTVASYLTSLSSQSSVSVTNADGAVIQSSLINTHRTVPCLAVAPTATVGGLAAAVTYAGWVPDSIAGLYQVNVRLPSRTGSFTNAAGAAVTNISVPVQLPIVVTAGGNASQAMVSLWVAPQLKVTGPTTTGLSGTVGTAWSSSNNVVAASEGTATYAYAVSSGLLPNGLTLDPTAGTITGTPAAYTSGAYIVTATATDSTPNYPVTGSVTFTLNVAGGLFLSAPSPTLSGTASGGIPVVATVQASGGVPNYTYTMAAVTGISVDSATGIVTVAAGVATVGSHVVVVTATDSTTGTPLTGTITFTVVLS